jgi:hypothetical protein
MSEQQPTGAGTGKPASDESAGAGASDVTEAEAASDQTTNAELRDELDSIRAIGER